MKYSQLVVVKRWIPILKEYERTKGKVFPPTNKNKIRVYFGKRNFSFF